jgi:RNA polymerase-binding transcription factor DksA
MNNDRQRSRKKVEARALVRQTLMTSVSSTIGRIQSSDMIASFEDGDRYICSVCDLPVKVCAMNPAANCQFKVLENTELDLLRLMAKNLVAGKSQTCLECGKPLSSKQLNVNPLQELCAACQPRAQKKRRRSP